ncbi:hypothetical protein AURDEDRAFT_168157 [Auricularia subglabra TFB-10046 SS5]|nr:hypothetical protein AURDEDRAFT_168157 [Auricularia subglabra TFB-10046 SS5]
MKRGRISVLYDQPGTQAARPLSIDWCADCLKDPDRLYSGFVHDLRDALPSPENVLAHSADTLRHRSDMLVDVDGGTLLTSSVPGTSPIERLPFDVLATILLSVSFSATDRLAICGVSRHFRDTVFDLRLFWTRIHLQTESDLDQLDAMLLWSDPALLHILIAGDIHGYGEWLVPTLSAFDEDLAASLLAPQVSRIATLHLHVLDTDLMAPLISNDLVFEVLEDLKILSCFPCHFSLSAPRLKRLVLHQVAPRAWDSVLSARLEELFIDDVPPESLANRSLCKIIGSCSALQKMLLSLRTEPAACPLHPHLWVVPNIRVLCVVLPLAQVLEVALSLPIANVGYFITIPVDDLPSHADPLSNALIRRLLTGVRRLDFYSSLDTLGSFARFDGDHYVRDLRLAQGSMHPQAKHLWHIVCINLALTSLNEVGVQEGHWDTCAHAFDAHPPDIPDFKLCLAITCFREESGSRPFRTLNCGNLTTVILEEGFNPSADVDYALLERAVLFISSGIVSSSQSVVHICICKVLKNQSYSREGDWT